MIIDGYEARVEGGLARVSARVSWEDCERSPRTVSFETEARFADGLSCRPDAFLVAAIIPAMHHGEQRIRIEGEICPRLRNGLSTIQQHLRTWYGDEGHLPILIEPTRGFAPSREQRPPRVASFMSGGVDALATLRRNRLDFPLDHPGAIQDCFLLHGFDIGGIEALDPNRRNFNVLVASLSELGQEEGVELIPVYTDLRYLDDDTTLFGLEWFGGALAAVAHAFGVRISSALIASSASVNALSPLGSHPLLDPNYSSAAVDIRHDCVELPRLEKVRLIAGWETGLRHIRSCNETYQPEDVLNCGRCEKCLRTMTQLLLQGKLGDAPTYPLDDISPADLRSIHPIAKGIPPGVSPDERKELLQWAYRSLSPGNADYWREMLDPLRGIDRHDLVEVIESSLAEFDRQMERAYGRDWRGRLRRFDRRYLGGTLRKLRGLLRGRSSAN